MSPRPRHRRAAGMRFSELAPCSAAPVRIKPKTGPAQGAQRRPVATPSSAGARTLDPAPLSAACESRFPKATTGLVRLSDSAGKSRTRPNPARSARAAMRPYRLASTAQPPPTAASVAMAAKVSAMPASIGNPWRRNGLPALANTKGRTGRMQGLRIVRTPPR